MDSVRALDAALFADSLAAAAQPSCQAIARPTVRLTRYERCALRAFARRCHPDDGCMIKCLATGDARTIGGGCWHVCYAYTGVPMVPPPGTDACDSLPDWLPDSLFMPPQP